MIQYNYSTSTFVILISSYGLSSLFVFTFSIVCTTSRPESTRPKIVCFLSSHGVAFVVMKNWDPLVAGPAFAMLTVYGLMSKVYKLNTPRIRTTGRRNAPVMFQIIRKLIFKFFAPNGHTTSPITQRISSLDHKLWNDTMEDDTLKVAASGMANEVLYSFRCLLWK